MTIVEERLHMNMLEIGQKRRLIDIVDELSRENRGKHFCEIGLVNQQGTIKYIYVDYAGSIDPWYGKVVPVVNLQIEHDHLPTRFEHLLALIRSQFQGVGFQLLVVENHSSFIEIHQV